jgi:circadian clock protein KaiC
MLAGGLRRGTSALVIGAAGTGKSSLAAQFALAAAERGEPAAIYTFEESLATWHARAASFGLETEKHVASGLLELTQIDPAELSPGQLSAMVRNTVEQRGARVVVIDSLNGFLQSVPEENFMMLHMHELLTYLGQQGVTTMLIIAQHGFLGAAMQSPADVSYLADAVLTLRYFEAAGAIRQTIAVVKNRSGSHERTLRELTLGKGGLHIGEPLRDFYGVLTGIPTYQGRAERLHHSDGTGDQ